jgi:glycosyltransferase involved in cell wall biosynthesis
MKIAYVTTFDSSNEHAWSGTGYYMHKAMEGSGCRIEKFGNLKVKMDLLFKLKKVFYKYLLSKNYQKQREPTIVISYAQQLAKKLVNQSYDAILSPGTIPVAHLRSERPVVFWTDATFASMLNFYPDFGNLPKESIRHGNEMEQAALDNCSLAIYSSAWAARSALYHYKVDPTKVKVVPFGANIDRNPGEDEIDFILGKKEFDVCRLLFVGVDWQRKGGQKAIDVATYLNQSGVKAELHVVGSTPTGPIPPFVTAHGFLSRNTPAEKIRLYELYAQSHFLILPTLADCVPVVIAEACSFGLPSITTNVGGIESAVINGLNGQTFAVDAHPANYARYVADIFGSPQKYKALAYTSFGEFTNNLNWRVAGSRVRELMEQL